MSEAITLSPSSINTFFDCPRLFYHRYILGKDIEPNVHLYRGSLVHETIEEMFNRSYYSEDFVQEGVEYFRENWNPEVEEFSLSDSESEKFRKESEQMLENFFKRFKDRIDMMEFNDRVNDENHAWNLLKPRLREHKVHLEDENLIGYIDSVEEDFNDRLFLIDYKTSKLYKNIVKEKYIRQLRLYAYLYEKQEGRLPDFVGVNYLKYGKTFMFNVTQDMLAMAEHDIDYVRNHIGSEEKSDYPRGCSNSKYCDCRQFEDEVTEV